MIGHGQVEGFTEKYGMEYRRARTATSSRTRASSRGIEREIFAAPPRAVAVRGRGRLPAVRLLTADGGGVDEDVYAYSNGHGPDRSLVVYHNRFASVAGWIRDSVPFVTKAARRLEDAGPVDAGRGARRAVRRRGVPRVPRRPIRAGVPAARPRAPRARPVRRARRLPGARLRPVPRGSVVRGGALGGARGRARRARRRLARRRAGRSPAAAGPRSGRGGAHDDRSGDGRAGPRGRRRGPEPAAVRRAAAGHAAPAGGPRRWGDPADAARDRPGAPGNDARCRDAGCRVAGRRGRAGLPRGPRLGRRDLPERRPLDRACRSRRGTRQGEGRPPGVTGDRPVACRGARRRLSVGSDCRRPALGRTDAVGYAEATRGSLGHAAPALRDRRSQSRTSRRSSSIGGEPCEITSSRCVR